jgi:hypothetical protein
VSDQKLKHRNIANTVVEWLTERNRILKSILINVLEGEIVDSTSAAEYSRIGGGLYNDVHAERSRTGSEAPDNLATENIRRA